MGGSAADVSQIEGLFAMPSFKILSALLLAGTLAPAAASLLNAQEQTGSPIDQPAATAPADAAAQPVAPITAPPPAGQPVAPASATPADSSAVSAPTTPAATSGETAGAPHAVAAPGAADSGNAAAAANQGPTIRAKQALESFHSKVDAKLDTLGQHIEAARERFVPTGLFDRANASFAAFCTKWEGLLHDRELNNLRLIKWDDKDGFKVGTYLGYSRVESCVCKKSSKGYPVGTMTYEETHYYLAGKTVDEAQHATPKPVDVTRTTELFRFDQKNWAY